MPRRVSLVPLLLTFACVPRAMTPDSSPSEVTVYEAASVRTQDPDVPSANALAVRGGRLVGVGDAEVLRERFEGASVVRLPRAVIVPGLQDAHAHLYSLGKSLTTLSLKGARSRAEALARVKEAGPGSYQGEWLVGRGWDQNDWDDAGGKFPDRAALDAVVGNTPALLTRIDGHAAWASGEALRRAGIDSKTADPPGGRIERDARGEPTGILVDNAIDLVAKRLPPVTEAQREARLIAALKKCAEVGLTVIHDAGMDLATFEQLARWDAMGLLPLRVYAMADGQGDEAQAFLDRGIFSGRRLELRAVKFLADGALGSRGAALHAPYSDAPSERGLLLIPEEELQGRFEAFMRRGFQVAVHAIGDRANTVVLKTLTAASEATGTRELRHRVEHAQIVRPEDFALFEQGNLIASMQPVHATSDMPWAGARLGEARLRGAYAWKSLADAGAPLAFGSDFPVEEPEPLHGLYAARTRQDERGQPDGGFFPEERLDGAAALAGFTSGAAFASFAEGRRGQLKEGYDADFTVLSVDPVDAPASQVRAAKVLLTVVDGQVVYRSE